MPQKPDAATIWRVLLAGYWLALAVGTHLPPTLAGMPGDFTDKLVHAAAFAVLAWLLAMAWQNSAGRLNGRHLQFAWLAVVLYGAADELTQLLVGRSATMGDWLADAVGAALGLVIFSVWQRKAG
jgi:VanZ family protein